MNAHSLYVDHSLVTTLTACSWAVVSITAALAAVYPGPHGSAFAGIEDARRWWRRGLCLVLCFATAARTLVVLDGSKTTTWDDVVIAVTLAIFAVFYWKRYISHLRLPDPRDQTGTGR